MMPISQVKEEWFLQGSSVFIGIPPWVRPNEAKYFYNDDDSNGMMDYWSEMLYDAPGRWVVDGFAGRVMVGLQ